MAVAKYRVISNLTAKLHCGGEFLAVVRFWTCEVDGQRTEQSGDEHAWDARVSRSGMVASPCCSDCKNGRVQLRHGAPGAHQRAREHELLARQRAVVLPGVGF